MATKAEWESLPFEEAITFFRSKIRIPSERWNDLLQADHDFGFMVAGATKAELLTDFQSAIDSAIAEGTTLAEFRKQFDTIVQKHGWSYKGSRGWRSEVIYSTNIRSAYQAGRYQQMTDPDVLAYRPNWLYQHGDSVRPRPLHQSWSGTVLPADHPWWESHYTPNGWGCKCRVVALSDRDLKRKGLTISAKAPDDGTYQWVNKKTGEEMEIPRGIDPGWNYTPGRAPKQDRERILKTMIAGVPKELQAKVREEAGL